MKALIKMVTKYRTISGPMGLYGHLPRDWSRAAKFAFLEADVLEYIYIGNLPYESCSQ